MKKHREKLLTIRKHACKRCSFKFFNNIKFHQHVQNYHQKKFATKLVKFIFNEFALFASSNTFLQIFSRTLLISSLTSLSTFFIILSIYIEFILFIFIEFILFATLFTTSKKQIFWAKIVSKSSISSRFSRLSRFVFEFLKSASISLFTSSTFLSTSLSTRFYMTMNDLFAMFVEKSKSLNLSQRQKNAFFQYHWQFNKLVISHQTRIISYFLSSLNSFKFNVLSKSTFCLFIRINASRRVQFFARIFF